ncbi:uncharacterized protein LOC108215176 isoform X3 [Daucus carota subsp. sativus]|uniref:uncharacterized protein LOC108215176 isoform X3 n=1 Tax=Daucus carota subsp. sativus TaxID=79200 RepID=UPI0007EFB5A9|nr:PREDICTED: uncharacterized protein LOC108215176 isoform X1 [Daucus carota subsp. sativus]
MDLNGFEPIFKQPKTEWSDPNFSPLRSFIVCVDAPDSTELRIQATDFHSNSWMTILSVDQLDDMRDTTGIGGSWSEFLAYVAASIQSEETKLGFEGKSEVDGPAYAKLIAQKTKGLPKISFPLDKLEAAAATEVRRNVSLALFGAFDTCQSLLVKEREAGQKLKELIAAEQEKSHNLKTKLDSVLSSKRHKSHNVKEDGTSQPLSGNTLLGTSGTVENKHGSQKMGPSKVANRVVPAYRRSKVRGVLLQDTEDDADN